MYYKIEMGNSGLHLYKKLSDGTFLHVIRWYKNDKIFESTEDGDIETTVKKNDFILNRLSLKKVQVKELKPATKEEFEKVFNEVMDYIVSNQDYGFYKHERE